MRDYLAELLLSNPRGQPFTLFRPAATRAQKKQVVSRSKSQFGGEYEEYRHEKRSMRGDSSNEDVDSDTCSLISKRHGDRKRMHTKSMIEIGGRGNRSERSFHEVPRRKNSTRSISRGASAHHQRTQMTKYEERCL